MPSLCSNTDSGKVWPHGLFLYDYQEQLIYLRVLKQRAEKYATDTLSSKAENTNSLVLTDNMYIASQCFPLKYTDLFTPEI